MPKATTSKVYIIKSSSSAKLGWLLDNTIVVAVAKADTRKSRRLVDMVLLSDFDALSINSAVREDVDVDGDVERDDKAMLVQA